MTEAAQRRERQDAVKNRERILEVAQSLFDRHGVESVSMNRIAQEAGVGAGTLYRHFDSKSDLCFALMQDRIASFGSELAALVADDGDPRATLERMIAGYLRFKESKAHLFKGMEQAASRTGGPTESPVYQTIRQPFADLFEKAVLAEGIEGRVDALLRADLLLATLIGGSFRAQQEAHGLSTEAFTQALCEVFYPRA